MQHSSVTHISTYPTSSGGRNKKYWYTSSELLAASWDSAVSIPAIITYWVIINAKCSLLSTSSSCLIRTFVLFVALRGQFSRVVNTFQAVSLVYWCMPWFTTSILSICAVYHHQREDLTVAIRSCCSAQSSLRSSEKKERIWKGEAILTYTKI